MESHPSACPPWNLAELDGPCVKTLMAELGLAETTARVLAARGLGDCDRAQYFLQPRLGHLRSPERMAGFTEATARIEEALGRGERIGVFGDYDVDGVTSAALLTSYLRACGATVEVRVARRSDGYGFVPERAREFLALGCRLIITCDCGTSDHEAVRIVRDHSSSVIVVDHHQVPAEPSCAFALINPHQPGCEYPFKGLASVGIAFFLAAALRTRMRQSKGVDLPDPRQWLDLVALGTIADLAPLRDENRVLVHAGLRLLGGERRRPGIEALCQVARLQSRPVAFDVGFRLSPRLNAPGRLGDAQPALELLLAQDRTAADHWAGVCEDANRRRQQIQEEVYREAAEMARAQEDAPAMLCVGPHWNEGVLGVVAARLLDRYDRPVAVLAAAGEGAFRGSVRSIPAMHAQQALARVGHLLQRFGGHAAAAGLTVGASELDSFSKAWQEVAQSMLSPVVGGPRRALIVDAHVALSEVDETVADELAQLGPFGMGNPEPLLATQAIATRTRVVGKDHLQMTLEGSDSYREAIAFRLARQDPGPGAALWVAFVPEIDQFWGARRLRLRVRELALRG